MPSRRRPPAAVGKPSFAYFPVDYLPHDVWRPDEPTDLRDGDLPDQRRTKDPKTMARTAGILGIGPKGNQGEEFLPALLGVNKAEIGDDLSNLIAHSAKNGGLAIQNCPNP
ncbi:hypothetical protein THAOC_28414, partial [Thalassiosira oceanica]